ncbi:hypothetical protein QYZ42_06605 [Vibrio parahaemolyticus]|nr:hypothetical protein [Vibrio parahaemolyticus]
MINDFHFSHEFLSCDSLNVSVVNDAILDGWLNYGCLIAPKSKLADYREWLDLQDAKFSKKWSNAFTYNLNDDMTGVYKSVAELEELDKCFDYIDAINVPTLIINEGELKVLEIDSGRHERNSAEVVNINNFNESSSFKKSKELKTKGF